MNKAVSEFVSKYSQTVFEETDKAWSLRLEALKAKLGRQRVRRQAMLEAARRSAAQQKQLRDRARRNELLARRMAIRASVRIHPETFAKVRVAMLGCCVPGCSRHVARLVWLWAGDAAASHVRALECEALGRPVRHRHAVQSVRQGSGAGGVSLGLSRPAEPGVSLPASIQP